MITSVSKTTISGNVTVPGSKSHTIRAVLLGAMAEGTSVIYNPLTSLDCKTAMHVAQSFGAEVSISDECWTVKGCAGALKVPENYVDCENSGSTAYFAASMAALTDGYTFLTGDKQIRRRPIVPVLKGIEQLGGTAYTSRPGVDACPAIIGGKMKGGTVRYNHSLSQFVSSVMMVAPLLEQDTEIFNDDPLEQPYLQISIDWMRRYGVELEAQSESYDYFKIAGNQTYTATQSTIPSDWSSVAFPLVAAIIAGTEVEIHGVDFNDSQGDKAVVDHLIAMGADIVKDVENHRIIVKGGAKLHGDLTIDLSKTPDALPAMCIAAAYTQGTITYTGLAHVRMKETDRIAVMESELTKVGVKVESGPDYMVVHGGGKIVGAKVESMDDHRIAMAMIVCGLAAEGTMEVCDSECAAVSFPTFYATMEQLGVKFTHEDCL